MRILNTKSRGVTLVELSIVLAILGILVVATISGKSLIDISRATSTIQQFADRTLAFQIFNSTYDCIPGDCATSATNIGSVVSGNGDGAITAVATGTNEVALFEENLIKANLFSRTITVAAVQTTSNNAYSGILPKAKITGGYISSVTYSSVHYNVLGGVIGADNIINSAVLNSVSVLKMIDTKIDDGVGTTGDVMYTPGATAAVTTVPTAVPTAQAYTVATGIIFAKMPV